MVSETEAKRMLPAAHAHLTSLPNVIGIGVVTDDDGGATAAIAVYVRAKLPKDRLKPGEIVPETVHAVVDGVPLSAPTKVIEVGEFKF